MLKKNWYLLTPLLLIAIPALIVVYYIVSFGYTPAEAMKATQYFLQSNTRYTQKYSDANFARLRPGMDGRTVYEVMQMQPFERRDDEAVWIYSLPQGDAKAYHERTVQLERDKNNVPRVKKVVKTFHAP